MIGVLELVRLISWLQGRVVELQARWAGANLRPCETWRPCEVDPRREHRCQRQLGHAGHVEGGQITRDEHVFWPCGARCRG